MRSLILLFVIFLFPHHTLASDGDVLEKLQQVHDVSRLEFSLFKIKTELTEELRANHKIKSFNDVYSNTEEINYKVDTIVNDRGVNIYIKLNDMLSCFDKSLRVTESGVAKIVRLKTDRIAMDVLQFFANFGEPEDTNIYGNSMVQERLAELFLMRPGASIPFSEEELSVAQEISELMNIAVSAEYCPKSENIEVSRFLRIYKLNSYYDWSTSNGKIFQSVEEISF